MERSSAMLAARTDGETSREHEANGRKVIVSRGVGDLTAIRAHYCADEIWMVPEKGFDSGLVAAPASGEQFYVGRAAVHQQLENFFVSELFGDIVRRDVKAEHPMIDMSAALWV